MVSMRTKAMVVEISRSPLDSSSGEGVQRGHLSGVATRGRRAGKRPPRAFAALVQVAHLGLSVRRLVEGRRSAIWSSGDRDVEAVAEGLAAASSPIFFC
jgi:hypothetical protein